MRIKRNYRNFLTRLDKKRYILQEGEQPVFTRFILGGDIVYEKSFQRKVWVDKITQTRWAYVRNGYYRIDEEAGKLVVNLVD